MVPALPGTSVLQDSPQLLALAFLPPFPSEPFLPSPGAPASTPCLPPTFQNRLSTPFLKPRSAVPSLHVGSCLPAHGIPSLHKLRCLYCRPVGAAPGLWPPCSGVLEGGVHQAPRRGAPMSQVSETSDYPLGGQEGGQSCTTRLPGRCEWRSRARSHASRMASLLRPLGLSGA